MYVLDKNNLSYYTLLFACINEIKNNVCTNL